MINHLVQCTIKQNYISVENCCFELKHKTKPVESKLNMFLEVDPMTFKKFIQKLAYCGKCAGDHLANTCKKEN